MNHYHKIMRVPGYFCTLPASLYSNRYLPGVETMPHPAWEVGIHAVFRRSKTMQQIQEPHQSLPTAIYRPKLFLHFHFTSVNLVVSQTWATVENLLASSCRSAPSYRLLVITGNAIRSAHFSLFASSTPHIVPDKGQRHRFIALFHL